MPRPRDDFDLNLNKMAASVEQLLKEFPNLLKYQIGDQKREILCPSPQESPTEGGIAFTSELKHLMELVNSPLATLVISEKLVAQAKELKCKPTLLSSANPYLAMAKVNSKFFQLPFLKQPFHGEKQHSTAVIHPTAKISKSSVISPGVVIHEGVHIGDRSFIGANTVIEANSKLGEDCFIHPMVYIGHSCQIGNRVEVKPLSTIGSDGFGYAQDENRNSFRLPHYGAVILEDDVHVGANVNIDRGTFSASKISRGTKIDNHGHFGHNVQVGENCLITAGFISAGSSKIGDRCTFAGRASVNGHTNICSDTTIGPLSAVTNDIEKPGAYSGFPPIPFRDFLKMQATLASLPRMRKQLGQVLKQLGLSEDAK